MGPAWYYIACGVPAADAQAVTDRIRAAGLDLLPSAGPECGAVGVFIHTRPEPQARAELSDLALSGSRRILAIDVCHERRLASDPWVLIALGASDSVRWSDYAPNPEPLVDRLRRWIEIEALLDTPQVRQRLVGHAATWRTLLRHVVEVARYSTSSLLVLGESGTGKELAAQLVHELDARSPRRELVVVDCTTIVSELSGSEFFGHERGAYTGAIGARQGAFACADGGTLFLDEVAELPLHLQAQLLRVIQEGTYKAVGGNTWRRTDFRLVCATNRDLPREVREGRFRSDLYYRIAASVVQVPPLRDRREDIPALAAHFLAEAGVHVPFGPHVRAWLAEREYPGNVRELRQLVLQAARRHVGDGPITVGDLPREACPLAAPASGGTAELERAVARAVAAGSTLREVRQVVEQAAIRSALETSRSQREACTRLGVTPRAIQLRARRLTPPASRSNGEASAD